MAGRRGTKEERQAKAKAKAGRIKARKAEAITAHLKSTLRRAEALKYRLEGWSYAEVGEKMGITRQTAHELVQSALAEVSEEPTKELRLIEAARLDSLQTGHFEKAVKGDAQATTVVLNIQTRRARLFGLDAPIKQEHTGKDGGPIAHIDLSKATEEQLAALESLFGQIAGASGDDSGRDPEGEAAAGG